MKDFDLKRYLIENKLTKSSQLMDSNVSEEISNGKLFLYYRTTSLNSKNLSSDNFKLSLYNGNLGSGLYFAYDDPTNLSSGMNSKGGVLLQYSIPLSSLSNFLILDPNLQTKSLEQQLSPFSTEIESGLEEYVESNNEWVALPSHGNYDRSPNPYDKLLYKLSTSPEYKNNLFKMFIDIHKQNKLNQLEFLKELKTIISLPDNFDGILYNNMKGTNKTAVIYKPSLLTFEGASKDGINFSMPSSTDGTSSMLSPEISLKRGLTPPNSTIKKNFIKLNGAQNITLPPGLKIIGSLDLRDIPNLVIPDDLEVTNTIYVDKNVDIPSSAKIGKVVRNLFN